MYSLHTVASIEAEASGTSYSVPSLCRALAATGEKVDLLSLGVPVDSCLSRFQDSRFRQDFASIPLIKRLGISSELKKSAELSTAKIIHAHGLWMMPAVYACEIGRKSRRPVVLSPHGMLHPSALRYSRMIKNLFWLLVQGRAIKNVSCLHATSEFEYESIRAAGLRQPVAIIPNGIDLPPAQPAARERSHLRTVLSLGRLHPIKSLDRLILAWATLEAQYPDWRLEIAGPSESGYGAELERLINTLGLQRVNIRGPVYGHAKYELLSKADLFVLPSLSENFAMTVAESLVCGTPVIVSKGAPWAGLEHHGCGWWIDHGEEAIATALRIAMVLPERELSAMGARGRNWMQCDFGWGGIADQMLQVYRWLLDGKELPACVRLE